MHNFEHTLSTAIAEESDGGAGFPGPLQDAGRYYAETGPSKRALSTLCDNVFRAMNGQGIANLSAENIWELFQGPPSPIDTLSTQIEGELGAPLRIPVNIKGLPLFS